MLRLARRAIFGSWRRLTYLVAPTLLRPRRTAGLGEDALAAKWLASAGAVPRVCVDIGAADPIAGSNTFALLADGWSGLAVECDPNKFLALARVHRRRPAVQLANCHATPATAAALLRGFDIPREFGFLSLDIDGYDYFVLDAILREFRPALICCEINERIPPPLAFTVKFDPAWSWRHQVCYGQSICQVGVLCGVHDYAIVELHYNNAFLMPRELAPRSLKPVDAFREGYLQRSDRLQKFPWNAGLEHWLSASPDEAERMIHEQMRDYAGRYELTIVSE